MHSVIARLPSPSMLVAVVALLAALAGTGYASGGHPTGLQSPVEGLTAVSKETASNTAPTKTVRVSCPRGLKILGGGGHVMVKSTGAGGVPALTQTRPNPDEAKQPTTWVAAASAGANFSGSWSLEAHAICGR